MLAAVTHPEKLCASCGRTMQWRRKWAKNWASVKYCSEQCRRHRVNDTDKLLSQQILRLLDERGAGATICPSEAARACREEGWQALMEPARRAARRLVADGKIEVTQKGRVVDASTARGPIRLRKR
ncbi:MAG: DUF2256 and DUF3253 domain-containing protein [Pseudomonadota bacterium]